MINIAVLGTGKIIPEAIEAIQKSKKFNVSVIWARPHSRDKAKSLAEQFNVEKISTDLDEILNDESISFVYIGLVNSVHFEYAKKCLEAGKNVIVEKPFTVTFEEAKELADIAVSKKLYIFEAITNLHMPNFYAVRDALDKIGEIKFVQANFSQYSSRYDAYKAGEVAPAFNPEMYGGALRDVNVYNINLVTKLFGLPRRVNFTTNRGFNGVDTSGILVLAYEKFIASCIAAKDSGSPSFFIIQGDNGYIKVDGTPNIFKSVEISIHGEKPKRFNKNKFENRMVHEFVEFAKIFEKGDYDEMQRCLQTSLDVVKIVEACSAK